MPRGVYLRTKPSPKLGRKYALPHFCSIAGCDKPVKAKGWCSIHWQRWWKHGDPEKRLRKANGEGWISSIGYAMVTKDGIERLVHVLVAEAALGKPLPQGAQVHHIDENRLNNEPSNLVICPNNAYHRLIHQRMAALRACGNAGWRKCFICQKYSDPLTMEKSGNRCYRHVECRREYNQRRSEERRAAKY